MAPSVQWGISREINQFFIMLYKGMLLRKRHFIITGFEILLPILIASITVIMCNQAEPYFKNKYGIIKVHNETFFPPFSPYDRDSKTYSTVYFLYAPAPDVAKNLIEKAEDLWSSKIQFHGTAKIEGYATKELLQERAMILNKDYGNYVVGTVFSNIDDKSQTLPSSLDYMIRIGNPYTGVAFSTDSKYRPSMSPSSYEIYRESFFLSWQAAIEQTFIASQGNQRGNLTFDVMMQRFPFPEYQDESSISFFFTSAHSITIYAFIVFVCIFAKRLVDEKVNHSRELLRMMGMTDCVYYTSTFLNAFLVTFIAVCIITILYKIPVSTATVGTAAVLYQTDGFIFFCFMLVYSASIITMVMALTRFVNRAVWAVVLTLLVYVVPYSVIFAMLFASNEKYLSLSASAKLAICLHPNGALLMMFKLISAFEDRSNGIHWNNLTKYMFTENVTVAQVMAIALVSVVIYCVIMWYVDAVWPWQDGVPKPLYFPFTVE